MKRGTSSAFQQLWRPGTPQREAPAALRLDAAMDAIVPQEQSDSILDVRYNGRHTWIH